MVLAERKNEVGNRYGRLVVLEYAGTNGKNAQWKCRCDCGNMCVKLGVLLRNGKSRSCGCLHREQLSSRNRKYSLPYERRLYHTWYAMIDRCENKDCTYYYNYGGRGIAVCPEWHDYETFAIWALSNGYADDLTIDRINNNGNYSPENCRWSTKVEQENNKRTNRKIKIEGKVLNLCEWCRIYGISRDTVQSRLRLGWSIEDALKKPILPKKKVFCIETGETFDTTRTAGKTYGVSGSSIAMAASGATKSSCGFHWKYVFDDEV